MRRVSWTISYLLLTATVAWVTDESIAQEPPETKVTLNGRVVDAAGKSVSGVVVRSEAHRLVEETTTDSMGNFSFSVYPSHLNDIVLLADDRVGNRMAMVPAQAEEPFHANKPVTIQLEACRTLMVHLLDAEGNPAAEAQVGGIDINPRRMIYMATTDQSGKAQLRWPVSYPPHLLYAFKPRVGFDYRVAQPPNESPASWFEKSKVSLKLAPARTVELRLVERDGSPISGVNVTSWLLAKTDEPYPFNLSLTPDFYHSESDANGVVRFEGVPLWDVRPVRFSLQVDPEVYVQKNVAYDVSTSPDEPLEVVLDRLVDVRGRIVLSDGKPATDLNVYAQGASYDTDDPRGHTMTNSQGEFTLRLPPNTVYTLAASNETYATAPLGEVVVFPDRPVRDLEMQAVPAARIFGVVFGGEDHSPLPRQRVSLILNSTQPKALTTYGIPKPDQAERRTYSNSFAWRQMTDAEGKYEFFVGPGKYLLMESSRNEIEQFTVNGESAMEFHLMHNPSKTSPRR